ncbi:methionyl-tRNA formyltransferase [Verrucomicrobiota bacterium]
MRIVFMGSADIAIPSLEKIVAAGKDEVVGVITQPDRPKGRKRVLSPCPVKAAALELGLNVLTPEKVGSEDSVAALAELKPDLFVVVAYGQYIPERVLALAEHRGINMHPSLLPKYRGAAPIQWSLLNGDAITGVTIIDVAKEMDAGDMLAQKDFVIEPDDTAGILHDKLAVFGGDMLLEVIAQVREGAEVRTPQDHSQAVEVRKLTKHDGHIDWSLPAEEVRNRVRAFNPWPSCFTEAPAGSGDVLKVLAVQVEDVAGAPGEVLACDGDGPLIACGDRAVRLVGVQPQGRKVMNGKAYLNGRKIAVGDRLA